ncbi:hypothetical protein GRF29_185g658175 [Pseudopithomyces chartarum]|uniref:Uncharacterized protein n=1 Tax=Pseudopithomyces chartarum TaxID=1892770 RepID=A0AAN6RBW2_9PLEO|nr:hypothetical protein GRF29_185g658175 [Pseudopithomyces chartarum]
MNTKTILALALAVGSSNAQDPACKKGLLGLLNPLVDSSPTTIFTTETLPVIIFTSTDTADPTTEYTTETADATTTTETTQAEPTIILTTETADTTTFYETATAAATTAFTTQTISPVTVTITSRGAYSYIYTTSTVSTTTTTVTVDPPFTGNLKRSAPTLVKNDLLSNLLSTLKAEAKDAASTKCSCIQPHPQATTTPSITSTGTLTPSSTTTVTTTPGVLLTKTFTPISTETSTTTPGVLSTTTYTPSTTITSTITPGVIITRTFTPTSFITTTTTPYYTITQNVVATISSYNTLPPRPTPISCANGKNYVRADSECGGTLGCAKRVGGGNGCACPTGPNPGDPFTCGSYGTVGNKPGVLARRIVIHDIAEDTNHSREDERVFYASKYIYELRDHSDGRDESIATCARIADGTLYAS